MEWLLAFCVSGGVSPRKKLDRVFRRKKWRGPGFVSRAIGGRTVVNGEGTCRTSQETHWGRTQSPRTTPTDHALTAAGAVGRLRR